MPPMSATYWNGIILCPSPSRMPVKSGYLNSFLRMIINWRKRDRYIDTSESGETYDAEMKAAVAGI
ncbi:hypothetical protein E6H37_05360 [Candidatus Bathyarchaeota archaeon]|nr:MAG: hypothetical protein E6H37_05360 [Candidatus Bathyarchaeota archaeon]